MHVLSAGRICRRPTPHCERCGNLRNDRAPHHTVGGFRLLAAGRWVAVRCRSALATCSSSTRTSTPRPSRAFRPIR